MDEGSFKFFLVKNNINFYNDKIVYKPWGYEYIIYKDSNRIAVTFVKINHKHKTSLHCHPQKKTGFIILNGKALVQLGIYKTNAKSYTAVSRLVIRPGLFHSIKAVSKNGLSVLEFETPVNKNDLLRFKDDYGRQSQFYEGQKFTKKIGSNFIRFKKPTIRKKQVYKIGDLKISLEVHKKLRNKIKKNDKSTCAILSGSMVDNKGQNVISYGEIVKTQTLRILSEAFSIKKQLTILKVSKK